MFIKKSSFEQKGVRLAYVGLAFVVAVLYDFFLWQGKGGIGFVMFVLATLALFITFIFRTKEDRQVWGLALVAPIIALSASLALLNNDLVQYFVPLLILVLLILFFILYPLGNPGRHGFVFSAIPLLKSIDLPFTKWGHIYRDLTDWRGGKEAPMRKVAKGLVIALPMLLIFGWLMSQADAVFADWAKQIFNIAGVDIWRLFRTFVITLFASSLFYVVATEDHKILEKQIGMRKLDPTVVSVILALLNVLFGVFVFIQFKYLFGDAHFVLANNLTYAEYARAGFFQLVWVMVLAAVILLVTYRSYSYNIRSWFVSGLQILFVAQVLVVAVSALKRMNIYQDQYGFTVLRLYVEWFIYFAMVVLAAAGVFIFSNSKFKYFYQTTLVLGTIAMSVVCLLNVDYIIARGNIERFLNQKKALDIPYLGTLSVDAAPAIAVLTEEKSLSRLSRIEVYSLLKVTDKINAEISSRKAWGEFNFGVIRAANSLVFMEENAGQSFLSAKRDYKTFSAVMNEAVRQSGFTHVYDSNTYTKSCKDFGLTTTSGTDCAIVGVAGVQYMYVLKLPSWWSGDDSVVPNDYGVDYTLYKHGTGAELQQIFTKHINYALLKTVSSMPSSADRLSNIELDNLSAYYAWNGLARKQDGIYSIVSKFNLLPDGRIVESNYADLTNYSYQAVPDANGVRFEQKVKIDKL